MSPECIPVLRRSHSSASPSNIDPYDQAEKGFQVDTTNEFGARQPPEAKRSLSLRYSLHSSDSTLVDSEEPLKLDVRSKGANSLPFQGKY